MAVILKNAVLQIPKLLTLVKKRVLEHLSTSCENVENQNMVDISEVSREHIQIMDIYLKKIPQTSPIKLS